MQISCHRALLALTSLTAQAALAAGEAPNQPNPAAPMPPPVASVPAVSAGASVMRLTAVVAAVDQASRVVTLKGDDGSMTSFVVSPEVRNLTQVKAGDRVSLTHTVAAALSIKKRFGSGIRERVETTTGARAPEGGMPGAAGVREVTIVANLVSIDPQSQLVRLRGPQRTVDVKVADAALLKEVKVGDQVEARFRESIAVRVDPVAK